MARAPLIRLALVGLLSFAATAHATVGGPSTVEPLGYDPRDHKVFFLESGGGEGPYLQVVFFRLDDQARLRPRRARAWHFPEGDESDPAVARRLGRLRRRLRPLPRLPRETVTLRVLAKKRRRCRLRVTGEWERVPCVQIRAAVSSSAGSREIEVTSASNDLRLAAVYRVPGTPHLVAVVEFTGILFESGYTERVPLLLRARSP